MTRTAEFVYVCTHVMPVKTPFHKMVQLVESEMPAKGAAVKVTQDLIDDVSIPRYHRTVIVVPKHAQHAVSVGNCWCLLSVFLFFT